MSELKQKFKERDQSKAAEQQGMFRKFSVQRVDGSDVVGGKHFGCRYFVLDMDHDAHAPAALRAYAKSCRATHPELAADLDREFGRAQPEANADAKDADESRVKVQLDQIGKSIGYGRAIQILGQLWDDMLQAQYSIASRHQESMFRREDIERTEAGLPIGRKVVYYQKRGNRGQITAWMPFDAEIPNVSRIVSDTPLYGRTQPPEVVVMDASKINEIYQRTHTHCYDGAAAGNFLREVMRAIDAARQAKEKE